MKKYRIQDVVALAEQKTREVYEVFKDFFGEDKVDYQDPNDEKDYAAILSSLTEEQKDEEGSFWELEEYDIKRFQSQYLHPSFSILVWWPRVKVTNEYDKSIYIDDLYVKIDLYGNGYMEHSFTLTRASYPVEQWLSDYCHSHIPRIPDEGRFERPCLGNGPIRHTIASLRNSNDPLLWQLFCQELSMYVTVESLKGGPYIKLESVGVSKYCYNDYFTPEFIHREQHDFKELLPTGRFKNFVNYYLNHGHLTFDYIEGSYVPGISFYNYIMDISNCFIDWVNHEARLPQSHTYIISTYCLKAVRAANGGFYYGSDYRESMIQEAEGRYVCTFKNQRITLRIYNNKKESEQHLIKILHPKFAMDILLSLLQTLNFHNTNGTKLTNSTAPAGEGSSQPGETVHFI